jgi:YfiH family protein
VSLPPFDGFNLGDHVKDSPQAVAANRAQLAKQLGARPVFLQQVHGVDVVELRPNTPDGTTADACWSHEPGVACTIMVADCLPVLFTHSDGGVVAAAHAGWRGLAGGVIEQTVSAMCQPKGLNPQQLSVWLGPCIGPTAFEVGDEVRQTFMQHDAQMQRYFVPHPTQDHKWLADLAGMARARLSAMGISNIHGNDSTAAWCTVLQSSRFFSYRRDGVTGRFAACIWRQS